jgi:hypothetical protein
MIWLRGRGRPPAAPCGDAGRGLPPAANENVPILCPITDPAAALMRVRLILSRLRQENVRKGTLLSSPETRRCYEECRTWERSLLRDYRERR